MQFQKCAKDVWYTDKINSTLQISGRFLIGISIRNILIYRVKIYASKCSSDGELPGKRKANCACGINLASRCYGEENHCIRLQLRIYRAILYIWRLCLSSVRGKFFTYSAFLYFLHGGFKNG